MNELINYKGDCKTAPATPGLLIIQDDRLERKGMFSLNGKKIDLISKYCLP